MPVINYQQPLKQKAQELRKYFTLEVRTSIETVLYTIENYIINQR